MVTDHEKQSKTHIDLIYAVEQAFVTQIKRIQRNETLYRCDSCNPFVHTTSMRLFNWSMDRWRPIEAIQTRRQSLKTSDKKFKNLCSAKKTNNCIKNALDPESFLQLSVLIVEQAAFCFFAEILSHAQKTLKHLEAHCYFDRDRIKIFCLYIDAQIFVVSALALTIQLHLVGIDRIIDGSICRKIDSFAQRCGG